MSIARHHADWLNLVPSSGPFVSMPVLMRAFPQGLEPRDPEQARLLRDAYAEWHDHPAAAGRHHAWMLHVLTRVLAYPADLLLEGQSIPAGLRVDIAVQCETLRPDLVLVGPSGTDAAGQARLLIAVYPAEQSLERPVAGKHWKASPATRMMELLHAADVPLGLVTNGEHWMLVYAPRGETTGYASWYASLWMDEHITLRAFHSLLGARRFFGVAADTTLAALLRESAQDQQEVTDQLGYQVRAAVEVLVQSFDALDRESSRKLLEGVSETALYDAALTVMMRLVFLFSAEERGLLHLGKPLYDENYAVSTLQEQLQETADRYGEEMLERRFDAWARLIAAFRAVHGGIRHQDLLLPAYGGSLFDPDRFPFLEGRPAGSAWRNTPAEPLAVNNRVVLHLLSALQRLQVRVPGGGPAESRRISFSALGVEQIGHVYEGLLDHTAVRAAELVLGVQGTRDREPEIPVSTLETCLAKGQDALIDYLKEETGRSKAALQRALDSTTLADEHQWLIACGQDDTLVAKIRPFLGIIREDSFGRPLVILPGSVYVTAGTDRRSTGTHYTPPSLTEPVVQYTLEPLVYEGPAEGKPREQWQLKSPRELLELKVCDMAMGSGAFLVQVCRYLSERLVEAWENEEKNHPGGVLITPEGDFSEGLPSERLIPRDPAERLAIARRYVADRCLYGVDINPMAVEMAKLSLWLITVDRDRPFSFLDHAFKCGDSLLGVTAVKQIENFSLRPGYGQMTLATVNLFRYVDEAANKRRMLETLPSNDTTQIDAKCQLYVEAEAATAKVKAIADVLMALELCGLKGAAYDGARNAEAEQVQWHLKRDADAELRGETAATGTLTRYALEQVSPRRPFHWAIEFPEIFARGGFDAFVGNPPFRAARFLSADLGGDYLKYLQTPPFFLNGQADFCAAFAMRAFWLLRYSGLLGLILTKTISEGDTRNAFARIALENGGRFVWVRRLVKWPGRAQVIVSLMILSRHDSHYKKILDGNEVREIDANFASVSQILAASHKLLTSSRLVGKGVGLGGDYFVIDKDRAHDLLAEDSQHLRRYISGSRHNSEPDGWGGQKVFFFEDIPDEHSLLNLKIGQEFVRNLPRAKRVGMYWKYRRNANALYTMLANADYCIIRAQTSSTWGFSFWPKEDIFDQSIIVFGTKCKGLWLILNSSIHEAWVERYGGLMKTDTTYSPSQCFNSFPLPYDPSYDRDEVLHSLAHTLSEERRLLAESAHVGITKLLMQIHDEREVSNTAKELRELREKTDRAVAEAYEMTDIRLDHGFHRTKQGVRFTVSEPARREILDRLLALNHKRYKEEVAQGFHDKGAKKAKKQAKPKATRKKKDDGQEELF